MDIDEVIKIIQNRHSVGPKYLTMPVPTNQDLKEAVAAALSTPNHLAEHKARIVEIQNREKLADFFEAGALQEGLTEEEAAKARSKALKAPMLLALVVDIEENSARVPVYEQWMTAGAFLMNFINVLELKGFALKVVSGSNTRYADVVAALCKNNESVACWIMVGTEKASSDRAKRAEPENYISIF